MHCLICLCWWRGFGKELVYALSLSSPNPFVSLINRGRDVDVDVDIDVGITMGCDG